MARHAKVSHRMTPGRRTSALSERLSQQKLAEARRFPPAQRLMLALELSDTCHVLHRACSPKR